MNPLRRRALLGAAILGSAACGWGVSFAQASGPRGVAVPRDYTNAEVLEIDPAAGQILLNHEAIRNLGMDPMAMMFDVRDPAVLRRFKPGDKVRFKAVYEAGKYVLVNIELRRKP